MFVKANIVATALAFATTALAVATQTNLQCSTGPPQCCYTLQDAQIAEIAKVISSLQIHIFPEASLTGFESLASFFRYACTPVGVGPCAESTEAACCQFNAFGGMAAFGCTSATSSS